MIELYYPSIMPQKDRWLKMAALYKTELYTINPSEYSYADYSYLNNDLDSEFLKQYSPVQNIDYYYFEQKIISLLTVISNSSSKQNFMYNNCPLDHSLKTNARHSILFNGKFTDNIKDTIVNNHYGVYINGNIYVSDIFITIYMGLLAQEIAKQNHDIILSAKDPYINRYQSLLRTLEKGHAYLGDTNLPSILEFQQRRENFYRHIITLAVPKDINHLTFQDIQQIRTKEYIHDLKYFKCALDKIYLKNGEVNIESLEDLIVEINEPLDNLKGRLQSRSVETLINLSFNYILNIVDPSFLLSEALSSSFSSQLNTFINSGNHYTRKEWKGTLSALSSLDNII